MGCFPLWRLLKVVSSTPLAVNNQKPTVRSPPGPSDPQTPRFLLRLSRFAEGRQVTEPPVKNQPRPDQPVAADLHLFAQPQAWRAERGARSWSGYAGLPNR